MKKKIGRGVVTVSKMKIIVKPVDKVIIALGYPKWGNKVYNEHPVKTIVKCYGNDKFDKEFGIKLAKKKLYGKVYNYIFKLLDREYNQIYDYLEAIEEARSDCSVLLGYNEAEISNLIESKYPKES